MGYYGTAIFPMMISFGLSMVLCPFVIPFLRKMKFGQYVREDGPQTHLKKAGTPTMGGVIILAAVGVTSLIFRKDAQELLPVLFATIGFGLIGFLDDYIKIIMCRSEGLTPLRKLSLQAVVTAVFVYYYLVRLHAEPEFLIPFTGGTGQGVYVSMPDWLFVLFVFFVMLGTVNGTNFTDGLDGLASGVTLLVSIFFTVVAAGMGSGVLPVSAAVSGALMGFLVFNVYPASVFMGDTGSLALGGFVSSVALLLKLPMFILIVGMIYMLEVLSVIIQVTFYKLTGGKRIFKMAPLHHHFEQCGWSETRIVTVFCIITALFCLLGLAGL
ncbi:MAG: phospho-N-acetylmuramoyl-pentapeptide-transferase [Lachnospiraceae bacterium]|nr:phospho-N-acetylmuramoyl-pentapeptide-transferase [Lachnospiraceae bacterium]